MDLVHHQGTANFEMHAHFFFGDYILQSHSEDIWTISGAHPPPSAHRESALVHVWNLFPRFLLNVPPRMTLHHSKTQNRTSSVLRFRPKNHAAP